MKKVTILIPTHYNDGRLIEEYKIENAFSAIASCVGGYTIDGTVEGCYRFEDGTPKREVSWKLWTVCGETEAIELRKAVHGMVALFQQECMYFEVQDTQVEFVK